VRLVTFGTALAFVVASAVRAVGEPAQCAIVIGAGGKSHSYDARLAPGQHARFDGVPASDFVRSTSGPCVFVIYNNAGFGGRSVRLGTGLDDRIRAGLDGVERRDKGGGETWRIRSVRMERMDTACRLRLGGGGVRMTYFAGLHPEVPAMDRIGELVGEDCTADIWNGTDFGAHDPDNRFKALHASGPRTEAYDPGFRVRSFRIMAGGARCPVFAKDQGRCLPQALLDRRLHTDSSERDRDRDRDGLDDEMENRLATVFRPIYVNHSSEDGTRTGIYRTVVGDMVTEPATLFQVHPEGKDEIVIRFMKLWRHDVYDKPLCGGHDGDSQHHRLYLRTAPTGNAGRDRFWYVSRVRGGIQQDMDWEAGDRSLRGPRFEGESGANGTATHLVIYFSKGKHHEYGDGGWSGQTDRDCINIKAHTNGRGHQHQPPLPRRAASLRSPSGRGDRFDFTNVGTVAHPFFDDLGPYGFPGQRVWSGKLFYSKKAQPVCRIFGCCDSIPCQQAE